MSSGMVDKYIKRAGPLQLPSGPVDWIPGSVKATGPDFGAKRVKIDFEAPIKYSEQGDTTEDEPNGRVHLTIAVNLAGTQFTHEHLGLGELLFIFNTESDLSWGLQMSRVVTYSELNRRLTADIDKMIQVSEDSVGREPTCIELYRLVCARLRLWKFIGAQAIPHEPAARGRDFVHLTVAMSHHCNIKNVFLADKVVEAGDLLFLYVPMPANVLYDEDVADGQLGEPYKKALRHMSLRPFVSKHRTRPMSTFYIPIGTAGLMYGVHYDPRDPYRYQKFADKAISNQDRREQLAVLNFMPTIDVDLLR